MSRVTNAEVQAIVDTSKDTTPFIEIATSLVDESLGSSSLSDGRLKQIELFLSAHFFIISDEKGGLLSSKTGDASESYARVNGTGIGSTRYGAQAIALDTTGVLASIALPTRKAQFRVIEQDTSSGSDL